MQNADVLVKITAAGSNTVQAEVDAKFDMLFKERMYPGDGRKFLLTVDFPISFLDDKQPQPTNFSTTIDGKPVTNIYENTGYAFLPDGNTTRQVVGYVWRYYSDIEDKPVLRHFTVHYTLNLKNEGGQSSFIYFLRTGAMWDGPIHKEVVKVVIQNGLKAKILSPTGYKPKIQTLDTMVWEILDEDPTEDIQLVFSAVAKTTQTNQTPAAPKKKHQASTAPSQHASQ
jgi:hypothetical protein